MKIEVVKGTARWYYRVVASNGQKVTTSQKYFSKGNAVRAAKQASKLLKCPLVIID